MFSMRHLANFLAAVAPRSVLQLGDVGELAASRSARRRGRSGTRRPWSASARRRRNSPGRSPAGPSAGGTTRTAGWPGAPPSARARRRRPRPPCSRPASATSGGGGGGGVPRSCWRIHWPRFTGEVRLGFEVSVRTLAWVSTPPRRRSARAHPPELVARDALDPVMPREHVVEEGVVGVEQLQHAAVLPEDVREVPLRLPAHRVPQGVVEAGEEVRVRGHPAELAELQPLADEVLHERVGPRVVQHPDHLPAQVGPQRPLASLAEQLVVGHAAPEEVREPAGQLELGQRAILPRLLGLDQEQELRGGQDRRQGDLDGAFEALAPVMGQPEDPEDPLHLLRRHRAVGTPARRTGRSTWRAQSSRDSSPYPGVRNRILRCDSGSPSASRRHGSAHDHRVDVQPAVAPVALVPAHVGGDPFGLDDVRTLGLARGERDVDQRVPLGDRRASSGRRPSRPGRGRRPRCDGPCRTRSPAAAAGRTPRSRPAPG